MEVVAEDAAYPRAQFELLEALPVPLVDGAWMNLQVKIEKIGPILGGDRSKRIVKASLASDSTSGLAVWSAACSLTAASQYSQSVL